MSIVKALIITGQWLCEDGAKKLCPNFSAKNIIHNRSIWDAHFEGHFLHNSANISFYLFTLELISFPEQ